MELTGKNIAVIGAGVSGRAAARFLLARGARVAVYDDATTDKLDRSVAELGEVGASLHLGDGAVPGHDCELAILSPGVPSHAPAVVRLRELGTEALGELELAARFLRAPVVAVTGTNGKTTVTELIGRILATAGHKVFVGGNLGTPLVEAVGGPWDFVVAEVSSFQLDAAERFHPRVAVLLNVTPDHLDRHGDLAAYGRAKARIFRNQVGGDAAIVNADDAVAWEAARLAGADPIGYSTRRTLAVGAWADSERVAFRLPGGVETRLPRGRLAMPGEHNVGNGLAACLATAWMGVPLAASWEVVQGFHGLRHRIEPFLEWNGIHFVDDSKATNVGAVLTALDALTPPVVLVGGGIDKGSDFAPLAQRLRGCAREVILVGRAAAAMAAALEGTVPVQVAPDWERAVRAAVAAARPGDTVLLSPACASFDFFTDYAQRGEVFQRLCRDETEKRRHGQT